MTMQKQSPMLRSRSCVGAPRVPPPPPPPPLTPTPSTKQEVNVSGGTAAALSPRRSSCPDVVQPLSPCSSNSSHSTYSAGSSSSQARFEQPQQHVPPQVPYRPVSYPIKQATDPALSWRAFVMRGFCVMLVLACTGHYLSSTFVFHLENARSLSDDIFSNQESLLEELHTAKDDLTQQYNSLLQEKKHLDLIVAQERSLAAKATSEAQHAKLRYEEVLLQEHRKAAATQENAQAMSRAMTIEKFGPGPHFVEFEMEYWQDNKPRTRFFTVELAPLDMMPATVNTFLQQVSRGLWDGTSFHFNAEHILGVRPVSGDGQISRREDFEQSGFGKLLFKEYNSKYGHMPYTLGFSGLGPSFYINKSDNSGIHGASSEPEPCFGRVVIGQRNVDAIAAMRGPEHDLHRIRPVEIKKVKIITKLTPLAQEEYMKNTYAASS